MYYTFQFVYLGRNFWQMYIRNEPLSSMVRLDTVTEVEEYGNAWVSAWTCCHCEFIGMDKFKAERNFKTKKEIFG